MASKKKSYTRSVLSNGNISSKYFHHSRKVPIYEPELSDTQNFTDFPSFKDKKFRKELKEIQQILHTSLLLTPEEYGSRRPRREARDGKIDRYGINGLGIGLKFKNKRPTGQLAIQVYVNNKGAPEQIADGEDIKTRFKDIDPALTDVIERPAFRLFSDLLNPGESVRHSQGPFGTMTCLVYRGDKIFIMSASHVFCPSSTAGDGDTIRFVHSNGSEFDIGILEDPPVRISNGARVSVDCAVAEVRNGGVNAFYDEGTRIAGKTGYPDLHDLVMKTGRHGTTYGRIEAADAIENVDLPAFLGGGKVQFEEQNAVTSNQIFAQEGDSGALVVLPSNDRPLPVGMVIAGVGNRTLVTPIDRVLKALSVKLLV